MSSAPHLPGVFATLAPLLDHYGYLAVAVILFLENMGVPVVPGETLLIAASIYAGAGSLNIVALGLIAVAATVAGSCAGYLIGRFGGHALALRYGRYVGLTTQRLGKAEEFFDKRGPIVVTVSRFFAVVRQLTGLVAGTTEMGWIRFVAFTSLGAVLWVGAWATAGYLAGDHIAVIYREATRYSLWALIALAVLIAALIGWHVIRRRRAAAAGDADASGPPPRAEAPPSAEAPPPSAEAPHAGTADSAGAEPSAGQD
jgi:membrane protein DedA with SNARE-associated domain